MRSIPPSSAADRNRWGYPRLGIGEPLDGDRLLAGGAVAEGYRRQRAQRQRAIGLLLAAFAVCLAAILALWEAAP